MSVSDNTRQIEQLIAQGRDWFVPDCARTIELMERAAQLARAESCYEQEAQAQLWLARSHWALGNLDAGHQAIARLEVLDRKVKSPRLNADFELARGRLYFSASEYGAALKSWSACLRKALSISAVDLYIQASLGVGNVYFALQQAGDALNWHEVALEFAQSLGEHELLAESYLHVAADLNALGQYELMLILFTKGEQAFHHTQHHAWRADWYSYRGEACLALQRLDEAKDWLHRAWEINRKTTYLWSQSLNLLNLGKVYVALQGYEKAAEYLSLAEQKINSFGSLTLMLRVYSQLSELGLLTQNYQMAWENRRKYHVLAIQNAQKLASERLNTALERRIRELDTQLMVLQTRQENVMLRQQNSADSELLQTLLHASLQDPLTGAGNRRQLDQEMPILYQRCREDERPLSVLMVDLDYFKRVNDTFGHLIGDEVIRATAKILLQSCRGGDLVARYGGEEFVLLLPGAVGITAVEVAERIRLRIGAYAWHEVHPDLAVTASIGVAELSAELDAAALLEHADQALYRAKELGRNRVESYQ
ncbi:GGDEF domain-containing protein [Chitinibacter sp. SCUT-21]|uniref:GGDEF domain-containing protein n=1 Tax=Chitinibacter sp. SCUT-21 TaxID=2970891 RepID=UPI0035A6E14B